MNTDQEYCRGYPSIIHDRNRLCRSPFQWMVWTVAVGIFLGLLVLWLYVFSAYLRWMLDKPSLLTVTGTVVFGALFLLAASLSIGGLVAGLGARAFHFHKARIVPYFETRVSGSANAIRTLDHGRALARNCQHLDEIARRIGTTPISHFGFADDAFAEELAWHHPGDGLASLDALLHEIQSDPSLVDDADAVISDIDHMKHSLEMAASKTARFSLLLLLGTRFDQTDLLRPRKGSFF